MFFPGKFCDIIQKTILNKRKEPEYIPARYQIQKNREGIFQFISEIRGSLTLETALVLPIFLFAMLALLQFASIQHASVSLLLGAHDTAKEMAAYAYMEQLDTTGNESKAEELIKGSLSAGYARSQIQKKSGITKDTGKFGLLQSVFFQGEILDLAGTFYPAHSFTILPVGRVKSVFRARVRAWTGRCGSGTKAEPGDSEDNGQGEVYVTETGKVYHKDPECTHIRLSIKSVHRNQLKGLRNINGGKYHACERCKGGNGGSVYISPYGDRYHSSLSCSGLKRTVRTISEKEIGNMRPCSKCGKN